MLHNMAVNGMKLCNLSVLYLTACGSLRFLRENFQKQKESLTCKQFICLPLRDGVLGLCMNKGRTLLSAQLYRHYCSSSLKSC